MHGATGPLWPFGTDIMEDERIEVIARLKGLGWSRAAIEWLVGPYEDYAELNPADIAPIDPATGGGNPGQGGGRG